MSNTKSQVIVLFQLSTFFAILLTGPIFAGNLFLLFIELVGIALGGWAVLIMMLKSKLNAFPDVRASAKLLTFGPYKYIRHPMYTSVFLIAIALVLSFPTTSRAITLILLIAIHLYKIEYEEKLLLKHFKPYKEYASHTHKLIPFVY